MAKQQERYKAPKLKEPDVSNIAELGGPEFLKEYRYAMDYYRLNHNSSDFKKWTMEWIESNDEWKDKQKTIVKNSDSSFSSSLGALCRLLKRGLPDTHEEYKKHWESLPGTSGEVKPFTVYVNKSLEELHSKGSQQIEQVEQEKKETEKKENEGNQEAVTISSNDDDRLPSMGSAPATKTLYEDGVPMKNFLTLV